MIVRWCKVVMVLGASAFALLVTYNRLTNFEATHAFVRHVMSMDTLGEGEAAAWRAAVDAQFWEIGYWAIVAGEGGAGLLLLVGGLRMLQKRRARVEAFQSAKSLVVVGATAGFLVWFVGFAAVGGEWFLMNQSQVLTGLPDAFRSYVSLLLITLIVLQPDTELEANKKPQRRTLL